MMPIDKFIDRLSRAEQEKEMLEQEVARLEQENDTLIKNYAECKKDYAREIFEKIEKVRQLHTIGNIDGVTLNVRLYELKKKYTEEGK